MTAHQGWAKLELMGHRVRWGEVQEVEFAGTKVLRVDCPVYGDEGEQLDGLTEFYGGSAIFCMTPCTEDVARAHARRSGNPHPIAPLTYRLADYRREDVQDAEFDLFNEED